LAFWTNKKLQRSIFDIKLILIHLNVLWLDPKEPKDQGKPDRSARFARPAPPSVQLASLQQFFSD